MRVFVQVLDRANGNTNYHVDMATLSADQECIVRYDPCPTLVPVLDNVGGLTARKGLSSRVLRHIGLHLIAERLGIALGTCPILHTRVYRIPVAAWTVNHKIVNLCVQVWICI